MKVAILLILTLASSFAGSWRRGAAVPVAAGVTFLFDENFEGAGTPSGWFNSGGDFDSTAGPLAGSQSYRIPDGNLGESPTLNNSEIYCKFRVKFSALPASFSKFIVCRDSGFTSVLNLSLISDGTLVVEDGDGGSVFAQTVSAMSAATSYDVEIHYLKGTGANSVVSVGFVAAGGAIPTGGNAFASGTNGLGATNVEAIQFRGAGGIPNTDFDNVQIAVTFIP